MLYQRDCAGLVVVWVLGGLLLAVPLGRAQLSPNEPTASDQAAQEETLSNILRAITQLEQERTAKQAELQSPQALGRQEEITQQIKVLGEKLDTLRQQLNTVATGIDLTVFAKPPEERPLNVQQRLLKIVGPVLSTLEQLTARPREIDRLHMDLAHYQAQQRVAAQALDNLRQLLASLADPALVAPLRALQHDWEQRQQESSTRGSIARQQLAQKLAEAFPRTDPLRHFFQAFFQGHGRNFLLACFTAAFWWCCCYWLHQWCQWMNPWYYRERAWIVRLVDIGYIGVVALGVLSVFLLVLYLLDDWVLLTLSLLFLLGLVWTSRTRFPCFWSEGTLLLNLGTMREGERVLYQGVPWQVAELHFSIRLVNPALEGGNLRLTLSDGLALRSRASPRDEPWFPTQKGDWVFLGEQTLAQVEIQTPENVRVRLLDGSQRTFHTPDFLAQPLTVLTRLCTKSPVSKLILRINENFLVSFWQIFETIQAYIDHKKSSRNDFLCKASSPTALVCTSGSGSTGNITTASHGQSLRSCKPGSRRPWSARAIQMTSGASQSSLRKLALPPSH